MADPDVMRLCGRWSVRSYSLSHHHRFHTWYRSALMASQSTETRRAPASERIGLALEVEVEDEGGVPRVAELGQVSEPELPRMWSVKIGEIFHNLSVKGGFQAGCVRPDLLEFLVQAFDLGPSPDDLLYRASKFVLGVERFQRSQVCRAVFGRFAHAHDPTAPSPSPC